MNACVAAIPECAPLSRRLPGNGLGFGPVTVIHPREAMCFGWGERARQLRDIERIERAALEAAIRDFATIGPATICFDVKPARWERLCRRWASKHGS